MAVYTVEALDQTGKKIRAQVEATTANDAIMKVKVRGYKPLSVRESKPVVAEVPKSHSSPQPQTIKPPTAHNAPVEKPKTKTTMITKKEAKGVFLFKRVKAKQLAQFTHQLSVLIDAGLPLVRSLKILSDQLKPCYLKVVVSQVREDVETGSPLSEALAKHPNVFDKLYVNMVKAGEAGGVLDETLRKLAEFKEKAEELKRKVIGASIYPIFVLGIAFIVVLGIMTFIVPKFQDVYKDLKQDMPPMTMMLMWMSKFIINFWYIVVLLPFFLVFGLILFSRTKVGRIFIDKLKLRLPVFGMITKKSSVAKFTRTLGTLVKSGVPILEALTIVKNTIGNEVVSQAVGQVHDAVREGESMTGPLQQSRVFDDMVINMINVGEETGELDSMLLKIADIYDSEIDTAVNSLVRLLEPMLILGLGGIVGFIVIALFMPLVGLIQGFKAR